MTNLKFFKGLNNDLLNLNNLESGAFYLTEDTLDLYYTTEEKKDLIKLFTNPCNRIKEIHSFYSKTSNIPPNAYTPSSDWSSMPPDYEKGKQIYSITRITYMDGHYIYSDVGELITYDEIDKICETSFAKTTTAKLNKAVIGKMILNQS